MSNDFINFIEGIIFIMIVLPPTTRNVERLLQEVFKQYFNFNNQ